VVKRQEAETEEKNAGIFHEDEIKNWDTSKKQILKSGLVSYFQAIYGYA